MKNPRILILDYGIGNVRSMHNAVTAAGGDVILSRKLEDFRNSDGLILPGVGAFAHGMANLAEYDLVEPLRLYAASGRPVLGVCLGMQMMMSRSFEFGETEGLGLFEGDVRMIPIERTEEVRLPHIGWAELEEPRPGRWQGTVLDSDYYGQQSYYFVHSFAVRPSNAADALAVASIGPTDFVAAIQRDNVAGTQFHPEKSGPARLAQLSKFVKLCQTS
jgi:glutamine amidotransferase